MRLIDADEAIGHIKTRLLETALNNSTAVCDVAYVYQECADNRIETWVDEIPTVDVVEVVRCGECKFLDKKVCARYTMVNPTDDDYCSRGEKR